MTDEIKGRLARADDAPRALAPIRGGREAGGRHRCRRRASVYVRVRRHRSKSLSLLLQEVGPRRRRRCEYTQTTLRCQALFSKNVFGPFFRGRSGLCRRAGGGHTVADMRPTIIAVGGFNSNTGKTTLVCELLRTLRGWEALKMTRGHYRSCGRDPHACCVAHLLGEEPVVRSGRAETYAPGKDTGRYWDAGASDVHWAVVTDAQVEAGFRAALARVKAPGVVVEGNSFLRSF